SPATTTYITSLASPCAKIVVPAGYSLVCLEFSNSFARFMTSSGVRAVRGRSDHLDASNRRACTPKRQFHQQFTLPLVAPAFVADERQRTGGRAAASGAGRSANHESRHRVDTCGGSCEPGCRHWTHPDRRGP